MFVSLRYGLERRDDALGVLALAAAVLGPRHVVVVPFQSNLVALAELRDGRGVRALEVREALDRLLRVAVLARFLVTTTCRALWLCPAKARVEARDNQVDARETRAACALSALEKSWKTRAVYTSIPAP